MGSTVAVLALGLVLQSQCWSQSLDCWGWVVCMAKARSWTHQVFQVYRVSWQAHHDWWAILALLWLMRQWWLWRDHFCQQAEGAVAPVARRSGKNLPLLSELVDKANLKRLWSMLTMLLVLSTMLSSRSKSSLSWMTTSSEHVSPSGLSLRKELSGVGRSSRLDDESGSLMSSSIRSLIISLDVDMLGVSMCQMAWHMLW